jgi:hypothetical protein
MRATSILAAVATATLAIGCFNSGPYSTTVSSSRFEVETGSVVLGARQLLVDTSNGDVWALEGGRDAEGQWVLLARGPEDARLLDGDATPDWMPPPSE